MIPYRGTGGADGHSFRYISAIDVLNKNLSVEELKDKMVIVGSTAPGLQDLRSTPVGAVYPGVETHANVLSGLLDGTTWIKPDYAIGYDVFWLLLLGGLLTWLLAKASMVNTLFYMAFCLLVVVGLNQILFVTLHVALPLSGVICWIFSCGVFHLIYGYGIESRAKRQLSNLFGSYVPPSLVQAMAQDPKLHTMKAENKELTVLFCDLRGFTTLAHSLPPEQVQHLLNEIFGELTQIILQYNGTVDKYMGDCVMAFWGAPVTQHNHADLAVQAALDMSACMKKINQNNNHKPMLRTGIGINTGWMCVGDMGSSLRRNFTVVGDAVNLASRLESLTKIYPVHILASHATQQAAISTSIHWQKIDNVHVKGRSSSCEMLFTPRQSDVNINLTTELGFWHQAWDAYRWQNWQECQRMLNTLKTMVAKNSSQNCNETTSCDFVDQSNGLALYLFYERRIHWLQLKRMHPNWDGSSNFDQNDWLKISFRWDSHTK